MLERELNVEDLEYSFDIDVIRLGLSLAPRLQEFADCGHGLHPLLKRLQYNTRAHLSYSWAAVRKKGILSK